MERAFIEQQVQAFTSGQFTLLVLGLDAFGTTTQARFGFAIT
jgi:hypothetical protein